MIRISELKQAILESERLDRLGLYEESAAALAPVVRVAEERMTKEAQWWRPIYNAGGKALEWLGQSAIGKAIPGIGKDIKGLGSMGHWGRSVVNDAEIMGRGRMPWLQRANLGTGKMTPEEMLNLDEIMRNPAATRSDNALRPRLNAAGLSGVVPDAAARGKLMSGIPAELRGLYGRATTPSQKAVMQELFDAHRNVNFLKYNAAVDKAVAEGLITDPAAARNLKLTFLQDIQLSPTAGNLAKGVGVGYAGAALTGMGHEVAAPPAKPSLFPTPDPNNYPPMPSQQNPSVYPSGRPSSVGQPPPQIYW